MLPKVSDPRSKPVAEFPGDLVQEAGESSY
jgi:hypothetical protein